MAYENPNIRRALRTAAPIMLGYIPLGIPCGILCNSAGMDLWMVAVMSILFYSGAGQYMIPNMYLAGNPLSAIVASVSLVNTRQMLYGTALSRYCQDAGKRLTFLFGATVTDESFGVNLAKFMTSPDWSVTDALLVNVLAQSSWILSNIAGALVGSSVLIPTTLASFAMTSLFICLLCTQDASRGNAIAALSAAAGVVICKLMGLCGPAILLGAALGVVMASLCGPHGTSGEREGR